MEKVVYERMHVCMIMLKNMVWFKSMMLESRVTTPFGKDYDFHLYLYHRFYQVPKLQLPSLIHRRIGLLLVQRHS